MLNKLELRNFKCFELLHLPLAPLTLLSGSNSSGKSSVLQSMVLLNQTMHEHEWSNRLMLNGKSIVLGTVPDVVDQVTGRNCFEIGIEDEMTRCLWLFSGERNDMSMEVSKVIFNGRTIENPQILRYLVPEKKSVNNFSFVNRLRELTYITAERVGPREIYNLVDIQMASVVGPAGEYAVSLLHCGRDERVIEKLVVQEAPPTRLRQVEQRMSMFFPGCSLEIQQVPRMNAVTLGLRNSPETDFLRPTHVGFGLTQVLPIIIAALSAKEGDVLLIENPEVHLHPAGQALMGGFLADVATAGVQVILETHSDHVLNGVRRAVKARKISPDQVAIHFFKPRQDKEAQVVSPTLDESGNIDSWPDGFFDQFDKDMNYFAGWGD